MGNTKLSNGNKEGLKKQVSECIDHAHAQGYKEGYDAAVQNNSLDKEEYGKQMYKKGLEDVWELVSSVMLTYSKGGWPEYRLKKIFDSIYMSDILKLGPEEALRRYQEEKATVDDNRFKDYPLTVKIESKIIGNMTYAHVKDVKTTTDGLVIIHRSLITGEDLVTTLKYESVDKMYVTNTNK